MAAGNKNIVHIDSELAELIPNYVENRHKDIKNMSDAVEKGDYETVRLLGHSMKGSGASYGFQGISDIGKKLEEAAKAKNNADITKYIGELTDYMSNLEIVYE